MKNRKEIDTKMKQQHTKKKNAKTKKNIEKGIEITQ